MQLNRQPKERMERTGQEARRPVNGNGPKPTDLMDRMTGDFAAIFGGTD